MANPLAANPWPQVADFAKKVCTLALAVAKERRKFCRSRALLGIPNSERRIEGNSKTTQFTNKRALHPALPLGKKKVFAVVAGQAVSGFV